MRKSLSKHIHSILALLLAALMCQSGCASRSATGGEYQRSWGQDAPDASRYLNITNDEPDTADLQCTGDYYAIPRKTAHLYSAS